MANIKSQIKRNRQNEKRVERNKAVRTALKTSTKKIRAAVDAGDAEEATARQREAARSLDKAVAKGIVHKRTAARRKSRLAKEAGLRFDWQARRYQQQARNFSMVQLVALHDRITEVDRALKSGAIGEVVMPTLVTSIAG